MQIHCEAGYRKPYKQGGVRAEYGVKLDASSTGIPEDRRPSKNRKESDEMKRRSQATIR